MGKKRNFTGKKRASAIRWQLAKYKNSRTNINCKMFSNDMYVLCSNSFVECTNWVRSIRCQALLIYQRQRTKPCSWHVNICLKNSNVINENDGDDDDNSIPQSNKKKHNTVRENVTRNNGQKKKWMWTQFLSSVLCFDVCECVPAV